MDESKDGELLKRVQLLMRTTRFITLATVSSSSEPWAATVNYVDLYSPPRLLWYSLTEAIELTN